MFSVIHKGSEKGKTSHILPPGEISATVILIYSVRNGETTKHGRALNNTMIITGKKRKPGRKLNIKERRKDLDKQERGAQNNQSTTASTVRQQIRFFILKKSQCNLLNS